MKHVSELLPATVEPKAITPIQKRLIETVERNVRCTTVPVRLYQHTVLCQTSLPYRDPGEDVRTWERTNGNVYLKVKAGEAFHPGERRYIPFGLPFGPKARLVLMHLNQRALINQNPRIEVEDSLTAFTRDVLGLGKNGRNVHAIKNQLARLQVSDISLAACYRDGDGDRAEVDRVNVIRGFDVWCPKDPRQRVLWSSTIDLSLDYYASLLSYAVPLVEAHIVALSHSSLALDIYSWLAQRLHRIPMNESVHVSWTALHGQFGQGYSGERGIRKFRQVFRVGLSQVLALYRDAKVVDEEEQRPVMVAQSGHSVWREQPAQGLTLCHSKPPVPPRLYPVL